MNIDKAKPDELKKKCNAVYEGKISFIDKNDKACAVEFVFRKPTTMDMEAHTKAVRG
jgi:hypothetical protein